jgi:hypothetical protein
MKGNEAISGTRRVKKHARWAGRCFSLKSAKNKSDLHKVEIYGVSTTEKKGRS